MKFEEEEKEESGGPSRLPIIGINSQFLDPNEVKMSLKESEVLEQEEPTVESRVEEEQVELGEKVGLLEVRLIPKAGQIRLSEHFA